MADPSDAARHDAPTGNTDSDDEWTTDSQSETTCASQQRSSELETTRAGQQRSSGPSSLAQFPAEIIVLVFEHLTELKDCFALSRVCHAFRQLSLNTPKIWTDVYYPIKSKSEVGEIKAGRRFATILAVCDDRSQSTIERANLMPMRDAETLKNSLELLQRSKKTLKALWLSERDICRCKTCYEHPKFGYNGTHLKEGNFFVKPSDRNVQKEFDEWQEHPHCHADTIDSSTQEVVHALLELLRGATNLHELKLTFCFHHGLDVLEGTAVNITPGKKEPMAHPKVLHMRGPILCCPHPNEGFLYELHLREGQLRTFFAELSSQVTHFTFTDTPSAIYRDHKQWMRWGWTVFLRLSSQLEYCSIPLAPMAHFREFPRLKDATLAPCRWALAEHSTISLANVPRNREGGYWHSMPALRSLVGSPQTAISVDCPRVKEAYLHLTDRKCLETLPRVLDAWPHLESLTLAFDLHDTPAGYGDFMLAAALKILTPSVAERDHAPKLRCLGLLRALHPTGTDYSRDPVGWASSHRWTPEEADIWQEIPYSDGRMPTAGPEIERLMRERRDRLMVIKLAGIHVSQPRWQMLAVLSGYEAKVTCWPHPYRMGILPLAEEDLS